MPGVCPKCISYHDDESLCPECNSGLLSPLEWKNRRQEVLSVNSGLQATQTVATSTTEKAETLSDKKEYILGFFISALLFFFAFLSFYFLFGDKFVF